MNAAFHALAVLALSPGLFGCFTSNAPLIGPQEAVFPYERIVAVDLIFSDRPVGGPPTLVKEGDAYTLAADLGQGSTYVRLKPAGERLYVVQFEVTEDDKFRRIFALLKVDPAATTVIDLESGQAVLRGSFYSLSVPVSFRDLPGLSRCDDMVCIADLNAYVGYARARMEADLKFDVSPDAEFLFLATK